MLPVQELEFGILLGNLATRVKLGLVCKVGTSLGPQFGTLIVTLFFSYIHAPCYLLRIPPPTAVWTRIEMCRDFFVKTSLTFFDQIILPIRNQMVGKV